MLSKLQNENLKNHAISDNNNKYVMQVCANEIKPNNEIFTYQKNKKQKQNSNSFRTHLQQNIDDFFLATRFFHKH